MPLEQVGTALTFYAMYTASKVGATGLTVTVDAWRINAAGTPTQVVTGASATAIGGGLYLYQLAAGSVTVEGEYISLFKTTDATVDSRHIPAIWVVSKAGIEYLDAAVSTRLPTASYTAPDNATVSLVLARTDVVTSSRASAADWTSVRAGRLDATISSRVGSGAGAISYVVTVTRQDGTTPISGASVWVTTDSAGTNVIAGTLTTSALGVATFLLDAGTYYLWRQAEGWTFANPAAIVVS